MRYLAESIASQYGSLHRNFTADGHLFPFEDADAAVRFSVKLIETWRASGELIPLLADLPHVPLRVGYHFGECTLMAEGECGQGGPDYPEAHYNHAVLLQVGASVASATEHYYEALRLRADYVDARYGYANLLRAAGDLAWAEEHYCHLLRLRPDDAEVHNNCAVLLEDMAQPERARKHYREALRIRTDYAETLYNYAFSR